MMIGIVNAGLRFSGLGMRFALSLFMARFMTLEDIGTFALMTGVTGLLPSFAGLGLNFFMARELVGIDHDKAIALARDRLLVSAVMAVIFTAAIMLVAHLGWITLPMSPWAASAIIVLELLGFDIQVALLSRRKPLLANMNLLFRTGIWVIPFVVSAILWPTLRTLETLAWFWVAGLLLSHVLVAILYRASLAAFVRDISRRSQRSYLHRTGWRAAKIYASDIGLAGSVYLDRFLITALAGVAAAGTYFFFASLVNSVYVICLAASVQIYQPELRAAYAKGGPAALAQILWPRLRATILIAAVALIAAAPALWLVTKFANKPQLDAAFDIVPILLLAYGVKVASEFFSVSLAAAEQDMNYVVYNVANLVLTAAIGVVAIPLMGFRGAAVAILVASVCILVARLFGLKAITRTQRQEELAG